MNREISLTSQLRCGLPTRDGRYVAVGHTTSGFIIVINIIAIIYYCYYYIIIIIIIIIIVYVT